MGVIINELQVEMEPQPPAAAPGGGRGAAAPSVPSLEDLRNLLRHQAERAARLRAH